MTAHCFGALSQVRAIGHCVTQTVQYQWKDANKGKFSETMVKELEQYIMELLNPEDGVQVFMHAIETATMDAVPAVTRKIGRKKGNPKWSSELSAADKHCKKMHYVWKQAGRPEGNHLTRIARKKANRDVRRVQRTQDAINRNTLQAEISAASENDQRLSINLWESRGRNATDAVHLLWMAR